MFTKEEQANLKDFGEPGLRIIGFKPQSMLPMWASVSKSIFIYPSEEDYVGSTRVFAALWQKLLQDKKVGLAWFIARKNAKPQIVALIPSAERLDESTNQQVTPAGLWVYPIPYADDIRHPPETPEPLVGSDKLVDTMRVIVQQLQLPGGRFDPTKYPNPSLQWHYRILQAMALEEEIPEFGDGDDKTIPKYRQIDKRVGAYVIDWGNALEEDYQTCMMGKGVKPTVAGVKRGGADVKDEGAKRIKKEEGNTKSISVKSMKGLSAEHFKKYVKAGKLGTATVAELKDWLGKNGHSIIGRKPELVARIEGLFED
jgi:ATP-dependent DNA helicase 2 subunit 1